MKLNRKSVLSASSLIVALILAGCSSDSDDTQAVPTASSFPQTLLDDDSLQELNGFWEQRGYGNLYEFENNRTTLYSLTDMSCLEIVSFDGVAGISPEELDLTRFDLQDDELSLLIPGDAFAVRLNRLDGLPERCDEPVSRDAQAVFDYLWNTFDQYYAFFELQGVDWAAEYARQSPRIGEVTDDDGLFSLLSDLISPLNDRRVVLQSDDGQFFSPEVERGALLELRRGFEAQSDIADFGVYIDGVIDAFDQIRLGRMDAESVNSQGPMVWGTSAQGTIGYVLIDNMGGFEDDATRYEDLLAAQSAMDMVMADLANTERMIVDVRLNFGGVDSIGLDFASRFVSDQQRAFTKTARGRDFESVPVEALLDPPATGAYLKPLTLIVGTDTGGAAELFAIALHRQPQVTVIGENTTGAMSEFLDKPLPNGWFTALSNEVYRDSEGVSFEGDGLSPDIPVSVFRVDDILNGEDPALDRALSTEVEGL